MSRSEWHIGIVGTFDVANYGDLLFPLIAEAELAERLGAVRLSRFSYRAKPAGAWPFEVTSVSELPSIAPTLDAILVGGGFLVRFDKEVAPGYLPPIAGPGGGGGGAGGLGAEAAPPRRVASVQFRRGGEVMTTQPPPTDRLDAEWDRRRVLRAIGVAGVAALAGPRLAGVVHAAGAGGAGEALDCVATPAQTEGPYFVDDRLRRSDIRLDTATKEVSRGVPLRLRFHVSRVDGATCSPLAGAIVDVWQCDALGVYSDVRDFAGRFDTRGRHFLRGYQVTDRAGAAEFLTIYPGWYTGRAVHVHFKVRVPGEAGRDRELTSQLYFDDAVTDRVHAQPPYSAKGRRDRRNTDDRIFRARDSGPQLLVKLRRKGEGYVGTTSVGLRVAG